MMPVILSRPISRRRRRRRQEPNSNSIVMVLLFLPVIVVGLGIFVNGFVVVFDIDSSSRRRMGSSCCRTKHHSLSSSSSILFNSRQRLLTKTLIIDDDDDDDDDDDATKSKSSTSVLVANNNNKITSSTITIIDDEDLVDSSSKLFFQPRLSTMMMNPNTINTPTAVNDNNYIKAEESDSDSDSDQKKNKNGLLTICFITFLFSTNSPVLHGAFTAVNNPPSVLLVNAAVSVVALVGLLIGGDTLEKTQTESSSSTSSSISSINMSSNDNNNNNKEIIQSQLTTTAIETTIGIGGFELGVWKFLGTTSNLFGLAYTTASHGALLIQLTTLIVPITRGIVYKEHIPNKLKLSILLALIGVLFFATDTTGTPSIQGDILCVVAAICYSLYDIRLYEYGKKLTNRTKPLITIKIATQAILSCTLLFISTVVAKTTTTTMSSMDSSSSSFSSSFSSIQDYLDSLGLSPIVLVAIVWSGIAVNAIAPFLQVQGQQIIGPTKCQTIYASQPLWAAIISFFALHETLGYEGIIGGCIFVAALFLAATTENAQTIEATTTTTCTRSALTEVEVEEVGMEKSFN
jgi:drug/metabolite transporter (DMT)-like permease